MKPRDIFGLAVRLLGLYFLYLGLGAVVQSAKDMFDLSTVEAPAKYDIIDGIISGPLLVVFDLAVAWWLIGGGRLVRRAYPETSKISENMLSQGKPITPPAETNPRLESTGMDQAEKKLAALVERPREGQSRDSRNL
jgi:hypothetical protein